jgi:hypothetical protein
MDADAVAAHWELAPHPEGGFYRETYRATLSTTPPGWTEPRAFATAILYLLPAGVRSAEHRVRGDELWCWHAGGPLALDIDGATQLLGPDRAAGHELHVLVPGGAWQSATPASDSWTLVACIVTPGFDFADFEMR